MLKAISPYVTQYCQVIATVTGINVEVVDDNLIRVGGTGMYEEGVGKSIASAGEVYRHVLQGNSTFVMMNSRQHELCTHCQNRKLCRETLSICTPIMHNGRASGIIGMVCFTQQERERILANIDVYKNFVEQMANGLAFMAAEQQKRKQIQKLLEMFLQIAEIDNRGIIIFDTSGKASYLNEVARKSLGITEESHTHHVAARKTGTSIMNLDEFEVSVQERCTVLLGHLFQLESDDPAFHQALAFDAMPHYTTLLSQGANTSEVAGLRAIVGESSVVRELKERVLQIAKTSSTVLITGESGTGKEMFARAIHAASGRHNKPFIPINCGAIPDALLESELFGYVSGAFTGANPSGYIGKFEQAHQGVIFLDEIGSMPLYLQVKLLRILQDRRLYRLGSSRAIDVDVRIIAATNEQLPELIKQRMFRADLFYRLNVIPFSIAPLRERPEDIPALADFFLKKYCRLFSKQDIRPTSRLLKTLAAYAWPGNVREFENVMEYLVNIIPDGASATERMLPAKIRAAAGGTRTATPHAESTRAGADGATYLRGDPAGITPLAELEHEAIARAIGIFGTSAQGKQQAADALGIGIATLYRKLKRLDEA